MEKAPSFPYIRLVPPRFEAPSVPMGQIESTGSGDGIHLSYYNGTIDPAGDVTGLRNPP
jgi:hypothetical protein